MQFTLCFELWTMSWSLYASPSDEGIVQTSTSIIHFFFIIAIILRLLVRFWICDFKKRINKSYLETEPQNIALTWKWMAGFFFYHFLENCWNSLSKIQQNENNWSKNINRPILSIHLFYQFRETNYFLTYSWRILCG